MKKRNVIKKAFAFVLTIVLLSSVWLPASAATEKTKVVLTLGDLLEYQDGVNWSTHMMYADGKMAYCVNPKLPAPEGTFVTTENNCVELTTSFKNYRLLVNALYYGYGGAGFNKNVPVFQTSNHTYAGNTMRSFMGNLREKYWLTARGSELHYLMTHRVLAYIYGDTDWDYALPQDWQSAILEIVTALRKAPAAPNTTRLYILDTGRSAYQKVILAKDLIKLQLQKESANRELTDGNSCYSLAGAKYNIYLDKACTDYFGYITTNASGFGKYGAGTNGADVPLQTYYAKEVTAPPGYALDNQVYTFKNSGKSVGNIPIYSFTCEDKPQNDPVSILLKKVDKNGKGLPGAEFTIRYYSGLYSTQSELAGKTPERSWVLKTDADGYADLSTDYLVSGDEFYYATNSGTPALPLGTISIQETKAPDGYIIDSTPVIRQITSSTSTTDVIHTYNAPEISNDPDPGTIRIVKKSDDGVVAGIRFTVKNNDTGVTETLTTKADGTIADDYIAGSYTITELVDETKYFAPPPQTVTVTAGETATVHFYNKLLTTDLTIRKTSTDGKVADIPFTIRDTVTGSVYARQTDDNGYITVKGLTIGRKYGITELVPEGYKPQQSQTITLRQNAANLVTFHNIRQTGELVIQKTSSDGRLDGFSFTVQNTETLEWLTPQWGHETDKTGRVKFSNVPTGKYEVTEVGLWYNYYTNPNHKKIVTVQNGSVTTVSFHNEQITHPLKIIKTSPDGNVAGIDFEITGYFDPMNRIKETRTYTTGKDGTVTVILPTSYWEDEYEIRELVPEGYEPQEPQTFTLPPEGDDPVIVRFNNIPKPDIKIIKTSDDGVVANIPFILTYIDNGYTVTERKVTDSKGVVLFEDVEAGVSYTITEEVPEGYAEQSAKTVTPKQGETVEVSFHNKVRSQLKIIKTSSDGMIEDFYFAVYSNSTLIGRYSTDENGEIYLKNLPAYSNGKLITYSVKELGIKNADGTYTIPERYVVPAQISKNLAKNIVTEFHFHNSLKRGNVEVTKTAEDGFVENKEFKLTGTSLSGEEIEMTAKTNAQGKAVFSNVLIGDHYTLQEIGTEEKYIVPAVQSVSVEWNKTTEVSFENILKRGNIEVTKTAEDGFVENKEFKLTGTSLSGEEIEMTAKTNAQGKAVFSNVLIGDNYTLQEVGTEDKYIVPTAQSVSVEWNKTTEVSFENILKRGSLRVVKTSEDGILEGFKFHLYGTSLSGVEISEYAITNENGIAIFNDVLIGDYTLEEVEVPSRYVIPEPQKVSIRYIPSNLDLDVATLTAALTSSPLISEQPFVQIAQPEESEFSVSVVAINNQLKKGTLEFIKTDRETGLPLADCGIRIKDTNGNVVVEGYTDKNGIFKYTLKYGKYTYEEFDAPDGYIIDTTLHEFEITENGQIVKAEMTNEKKPADITVTPNGENISTDLSGDTMSTGDSFPVLILFLAAISALVIIVFVIRFVTHQCRK